MYLSREAGRHIGSEVGGYSVACSSNGLEIVLNAGQEFNKVFSEEVC